MATSLDISRDKDSDPVQPRLKSYPKTLMGAQNRSFTAVWFEKFHMLEYSKQLDKVYCFCCRHFLVNKTNALKTGFSNWRDLKKVLEKHFLAENSSHKFAYEKYLTYRQSKHTGAVTVQLDAQNKLNIQRNRDVVAAHVEVVLYCAQQDIALRGHREQDSAANRGNFLELIELMKRREPEFAAKASKMPGNATFLSWKLQNEIIDTSASLMRTMILSEMEATTDCFSLIADETRDSAGVEQLSVCIRYVARDGVKERFLAFLDLHQFDAETLMVAVLKVLGDCRLNIQNCVAQAYDGCSVMSGDVSGLRKRIETVIGGDCPYVHCFAHRLNLVLVDVCCKMPEIRDLIGSLQAIYSFQSRSVLRSEQFEEAQRKLGYAEVLKLPQSNDTRWSSKKKGLNYFRTRIDAVFTALSTIDGIGKREEAAEARGYLSLLGSFEALLWIVSLDEVLTRTNALSQQLQSPQLFHASAIKLSEATIASLEEMKTAAKFESIWGETVAMAEKVLVRVPTPDEPAPKRRNFSAQMPDSSQRGSLSSMETNSEKLRRVYYQVIDNFVSEIKRRLLDNSSLLKGLGVADPRCERFLDADEVLSFCTKFQRFGFNFEALKCQLNVARHLLKNDGITDVVEAYKHLLDTRTAFPDLLLYYSLVLTVPVANASCERSFSSLKRIKTNLRSTMRQDRTSNLAMISINRDLSDIVKFKPMSVVDELAKKADRRLSLTV